MPPPLALALGLCLLGQAPETPTLRHVSYLAFLPAEALVTLHLASVRHSTVYGEGLGWQVVVGDGERVAKGLLRLEETADPVLAGLAQRLHVAQLDSGWNLARAHLDGAPWAIVCHADLMLSVVGQAQLYLWQPAGKAGRIDLSASVTREGCRLVLGLPGGEAFVDQSGDFDQPAAFELPAAPEGRVVELRVLKPDGPGLNLDDVELWLKDGLAPYLATDPDNARLLGARWEQWSSKQ